MDKPSFINLTKNFVSLDKPPYDMQSAINYLNFINNITLDNLSSMDSYDYEKIIYFENKYQCNSEI